jgi:hypothetical protein
VYDPIADELARGYALAAEPAAGAYRAWRRHNAAPYRSATHGSRYVNNYGSVEAVGYGDGGPMPPGAFIAKDSFTAASDGSVSVAPFSSWKNSRQAPARRPPTGVTS